MIDSAFFRRMLFGVLGFGLLFSSNIAVHAAIIDQIAEDFKPISGYVVMAEGEDFIIDLDKTHGILTGDVFSVIAPGKEIVHPVSQKVLGTLEEVKGLLQVTRIKTGFSFARPVGKSDKIKRGDPIRRYGNLNAIFWDYTGQGQSFFVRLQKALPDLKWQDYQKSQGSRPPKPAADFTTRIALTFILTDGGIEVHGPEFITIRSYDYPASLSKRDATPTTSATPIEPVAPVIAASPPKTSANLKIPETVGKETTIQKKVSPEFSEVQTIADLPGVSLITDFVKYDDQLLLATTNGSQIQILDVTHDLKPVAQGAPSYPVRILSVKWWSPDNGRNLYLAVTTWSNRDKQLRGGLFLLAGDMLNPLMEEIPRILGTFDLNADGRPETLLGQEFVGETFFGRRINELRLTGNEISYLKPKLELPSLFTVLGSALADVTGDGQLETVSIRNSNLYVYSGKKMLYKSPKQMGGSLSFLTYEIDPEFKDTQPTTVAFEISPIASDIDGDGHPEIMAVASDRTVFGGLGVSPGIMKSWLAVFRYRDGRFESGTFGNVLDTTIQGLIVNQGRVLLVATKPGNLIGEGAYSHLVAFSLSQ